MTLSRILREITDVRPRSGRDAAGLVGMVAAYIGLGLFSQQLNGVGHGLAVMWFPSGLAVFLIGRLGRWPAIFVASILTDAAVGTPILSLVCIGIGNSIEAIVAAEILRGARPDLTASGMRGVLRLIIAAFVAPLGSVVFGLGGLLLTHTIVETATLPTAALVWWLSDLLGILLVTPALLAWMAGRYVGPSRERPAELLLVAFGLSAITGLFFSDALSGTVIASTRAYVGIPILAFVGLRYGTAAVAAVLAVGGAFLAVLLAVGQGPFWTDDPAIASISLGAYVLVLAATGLGLAAAYAEREAAAAATRQAQVEQRRLATAIEQAADSVILTDNAGVIEYVNPAFEWAFGWEAEEVVGQPVADVLRSHAHPPEFYEDMDATIRRGEVWSGSVVDRRRDGTTFQLDTTISPIRDAHGDVAGAVNVGRDRSHERQMVADLALEADIHIALGQALQLLPAGASATQAAQVLCEALWEVPLVSFVGVIGFCFEDGVRALGHRATFDFPASATRPGPRALEIRAQAAAGPWAERWVPRDDDGEWGAALTAGAAKAIAYGPITHGDHADGLLVIGTADEGFASAVIERLPEVVDFTSTPIAMLAERLHAWREVTEVQDAVRRTVETHAFAPVFQPIVDLATGETVGFEALTRFNSGLRPDVVFAEAWRVGLGVELELSTMAAAIKAAHALPAGKYLSVNLSPRLLEEQDRLRATLKPAARPIVVEVTEHEAITDYAAVRDGVARLGSEIRLAVDDAGAGIANFSHIIELRPALVKLDSSLVRGVNTSAGRQALVVAMRHFARAAGCRLIAEGIETSEEAATLRTFEVEYGQGYLLGVPAKASSWTTPKARRSNDAPATGPRPRASQGPIPPRADGPPAGLRASVGRAASDGLATSAIGLRVHCRARRPRRGRLLMEPHRSHDPRPDERAALR